MACPALSPDGPFLSGMLAHIDCQAQAIGQGGYHALAASGSSVSLMLTGMLTIFVALFGYRMLLGEVPSLRDGTLAVAKIGMVMVLATSWPAFRILAYDVAMHGPAELAANIGQAADLPGGGGLVGQLQRIDDELAELSTLGTGRPPGMEVLSAGAQMPFPAMPSQAQQPQQRFSPTEPQSLGKPRWDPQRDAAIVAQARTLYLTGAIGAFASVRLVAGLLLALGPLFALFLLFRETRGLFEGWVRALAGAALGGLATVILLGVQVAVMRPWLDIILAERRDDVPTPQVPIELLALAFVFVLALLAALLATALVAKGFRLPGGVRTVVQQAAIMSGSRTETAPVASGGRGAVAGQRSRALALSDGITALQRREAPVAATFVARSNGPAAAGMASQPPGMTVTPLGQSGRRRTNGRVSASAQRRDIGA